MKKFIEYANENLRLVFVFTANIVALIASIWWTIDSNFIKDNGTEIEPMVTSFALIASLFGINFVNDKLTRPYLKIKLSVVIADLPGRGITRGICINIENHSMIKAFISNYQVMILGEEKVFQFMRDGFTGTPLQGIVIEPGQSHSSFIVKTDMGDAPKKPEAYGDLVVTTDIGYKFSVKGSIFREHLSKLLTNDT